MPLTLAQLNAEIDNQLLTNPTGNLTAAILRAVLKDIVNNEQGGGGTSGPGTGGTYNISGGNPVFPTYADAHTAVTGGTVAAGVHSFWTSGFYSPGDNGRSFYVDIGATDIVNSASDTGFIATLTVGEPALIHDTTNGRYFLMLAQDDGLDVSQFGAKPSSDWLVADNDVTPYLYMAQRHIAKVSRNNKGVSTIKIGPGTWYMGSTFNVKAAGQIRIKGAGKQLTTMQPASGVFGICLCSNYSFDGNAVNGWSPSTSYPNLDVHNTGRKGRFSNGTRVYEIVTPGTSASSGSGPTGTGSSISDGGVVWKYVRDLLPDEADSGGLDGSWSIVEDIGMYSHWDRGTEPHGLACGLAAMVRGVFHNCISDNFSGHGFAILCNGDDSFPYMTGNANDSLIQDCTGYYNGWSGYRVGYGDGNNCRVIGFDAASNGWFGGDDNTFLMGAHVGVQSAFDGKMDQGTKQHPGAVTHGGNIYIARVPVGGVDGAPAYSTETPGTGSWWIEVYNGGDAVADANSPAWASGTVYEPGGGFCGRDNNSRAVWEAVYLESGTAYCQFGPRQAILGMLNSDALPPNPNGMILMDGLFSGVTIGSR